MQMNECKLKTSSLVAEDLGGRRWCYCSMSAHIQYPHVVSTWATPTLAALQLHQQAVAETLCVTHIYIFLFPVANWLNQFDPIAPTKASLA